MKSMVISGAQSGRRIEKVIIESFPLMPVSALYKAFRKKDIKVNGVRIKENHVVNTGDVLEIFIVDDILEGKPLNDDARLTQGFSIVFEDANIMIVNKEQGIPVHPDKEQASNTLIDWVTRYLKEKEEYLPSNPSHFQPSLCHRLDRNTGGLLIIAKNSEALKIVLEKIKMREIRKFYLCLVQGKPSKPAGELKAYLFKDEKKSRVYIYDKPSKGSMEITTRYKVISGTEDISKLEIELVTGRTHQIRAHLAHIGHPVVGDGKYGSNSFNRSHGAKYQALWAYKLIFDFKDAGILSYLSGKKFEVEPAFKIKSGIPK